MKTMKKLLSIILSLSLCLGLTSPLSMVVSVRANATHTWRNSTLPLFTNLKDGDTVQISQSPSGTLRVPENCTITITGGSESMPVGSSNLIGFNIPETSKVVWKAFLRVDSGTYGVELIGNGTFEVADGLIEHRGGCSAVIHARIMQNYPNSADIIINGGKVHSRNNPTTAVVFNVTGNVIVNGGTLSIGEPASSPRTILAGPEHMREDTAIFINRGAIVSAGISSYGDNSVIIRRGAGTLTEYEKGSSADLTVSAGDGSPLDSSMAVWDLIDDVSGISYSRNDNSGFFAVPDVQVIPPPKIYVNDVYVTEPTVLRIKNAIDEALADENIDEVKITGKFTNADSVLEFSIPENKKVIWDAVYELPVSDRGRTILATGLGEIILTENADIITHGMNQSALAVSDNGSANATKFTMNGGKLTAGTSTQSSVCALELFDGATAVINAGALQNNTATRETIDVWRNAVLVVNGGSIRNREIGAVHPMMIRSQNNSVVFVTGGEFFVGSSTTPIASGGINEYTSATNFIGYYTGNNGAKFNSTDFSNDDNLFKIDGLDFNGYTYDENTPHVGAITVTFSDRLTFQSATGTDDALRVKQDDNNLIFSGTSNAPDITLEITGSLENGKVPVEFTTAPFGLNIDWCEFCERAETECVCERCELCRKEPIFCDCVIIKGEKYLKAATHLDLSDKGLTIADLTPLTEFPNLVYLDLSDNPITLQQIAVLEAALPNCNIIHNATEGCAVCGRHEDFCDCIEIKGEKYLKAATHLDLSDKGLTSADLTPLSQFPNLTSLDLRDNPITLQQIAELEAALPNCNIIHNATEGCAVCGRHEDFCDCIEIKGEKYLKNATHLDLSGKELTISDLTPLSEFSNLTSLDLRDNPITLQQIAELEAVLPNCNITHNAIEGCAVCGKHENFCDCIEIKGEKYLKTATHLDLSGKELTISDLTPLSEFSNLTSLDLRDNPITLQQIAELEAVLPNCNITHNTPCDCNEPDCEECFPPPPEFELGDCNNDGRINIADLTYLKYAIVRNNPEVFPFNDQCKVAGEEASDALNLSTLRNYLTGKTKQLTVDN